MLGRLDEALRQLLVDALAPLFGGVPPAVQLAVVDELFSMDPSTAEVEQSEPRPDDQVDNFPFNPTAPTGPYTLTKPPLPGPRRVYLTSALGDLFPLSKKEVDQDKDDSRVFRLVPREERELSGFNGVRVLYGVTAVYLKVKLVQNFALQLISSNAAQLEQAEALALGAVMLNRKQLVDSSPELFSAGDYSAAVNVESLKLLKGSSPATNTRLLHFSAEVTVKVARAMGADEGKPIVRIRTPGRPIDPRRAVDIIIGVEA
jgi:hypothetical protein